MTNPFGNPAGPTIRIDPAAVIRLVRFARNVFIPAILLLLVIPWLGRFAVDWLWAREVGYEQVFLASFGWRAGLLLVPGGLAFLFLYLNIRRAIPRSTTDVTLFAERLGAEPAMVGWTMPMMLVLGTAFIAYAIGMTASSQWASYVLAVFGGDTGITEPLFGNDIGFYLFRLSAWSSLLSTAMFVTTLTTVAVALLYLLKGELALLPGAGKSTTRANWHVGGLAALFFVLLAVRLWVVTRANLAFSTTGPLVGASYTDVHASLPAIVVSAVMALAAAGAALYGAARGQLLRTLVYAVVAYAGIGIVGRGVIPLAMQRLLVAPNELVREMPYLERHIDATRRAWRIDSVAVRDISGDAALTMDHIRANAATIGNIRLWDRDLLAQTLGQLQEIRTYYDFVSVNDDRYVINGQYRQVHLSARELNSSSLPTLGFINERLTFTHGMGLAMAPVNEVTAEGLPVLFVKDLPPVSSTNITLTQPAVYFGELTNSYVFVKTAQREFDYPAGDANIYTKYEGRGGIGVGSLARRMLFAWQLGSLKVLFSSDIGDSARVLMRRNIHERAKQALPFLAFDPEAYLVVTETGRLVWILDAYTSSGTYPYAARTSGGANYMRNSVKVTIDAYDGVVTAFLADSTDALARAYARIFPGAFRPLADLSPDLQRHLRYPNGIFRVQASLLATYHMKEPDAFYHREDQWQIPEGAQRDRSVSPYMRHMIMRLPGEKNAEFIYMTPFTPRGKDNLASWLVARMDGAEYGKLLVYRFPKQSLVYGPRQIMNRIEQDTDISRQLSLWDQRGSQAIRGELLVIPIEESLIYVQPIYLKAQGETSIPELKRVVVAYGNQVVMATSLDEGLQMVFGTGGARAAPATADLPAAAAAPSPTASIDALLQRSQQHYDRAIAAQRAGNWAEYGHEIEQLGAVLRELRSRTGKP
ncbi:MAG: UPF0182 family protein [Gemmatimonadaceae bacterium]|nr:UPF0182 family protein [Gemmatimonadaceae bacterium]